MENALIGIKRFIKNKNTVTIFCILVSLAVLYLAYNYRIKKEIAPIYVPYAVVDIAPKTKITSDMVSTKKVPGGLIDIAETYVSVDDIVGKYVRNDAVIPRNSIFYNAMLVDWEGLPSSLYEDIEDGYTIYQLSVNMDSTYGNSIFPGNIIDIYAFISNAEDIIEGTADDGSPYRLYTKFIDSIKVLAVTDDAGNNVFETIDKPLEPRKLIFAVPDCLYVTLINAENMSEKDIELIPIPKNSKNNNEEIKTKVVGTMVTEYINNNTRNLSKDNPNIDQNACTLD